MAPRVGLTIGGCVDIVTPPLRGQVALPARWENDRLAFLSRRRGDHSRLLLRRKGKVTGVWHFCNWFSTRKSEVDEVTLEELPFERWGSAVTHRHP